MMMCSFTVNLLAIYCITFFVSVHCNTGDTGNEVNVLNELKQQIESLNTRINAVETIIANIDPQCIESLQCPDTGKHNMDQNKHLTYDDDNTIVTLLGTGSGTPDISFVVNAKLVDAVVGNHSLLTTEPLPTNVIIMGYRATLLTSSDKKHCNGYLQSDTDGQNILLKFLKNIPLKDTVITHIHERMKEMSKNVANTNVKSLENNNANDLPSLQTLQDNCTAPIVGPDAWIDIEYDTKYDDCGFFTGSHQTDNNCYAYATDIATNTFPQPGKGSGHEWDVNTCKDIIAAAERDGLTYVGSKLENYSQGPDDGHYVALYIWPDTNFHWARMDYNGTYNTNHVKDNVLRRWSHKPGGTPVQVVDNNANCIGNISPCVLPSEADLSPWSQFCGYMIAIPSKLTID